MMSKSKRWFYNKLRGTMDEIYGETSDLRDNLADLVGITDFSYFGRMGVLTRTIKQIKSIRNEPQDKLTKEEIEKLTAYIDRIESLLNSITPLFSKINEKINEAMDEVNTLDDNASALFYETNDLWEQAKEEEEEEINDEQE